MTDKSDMRSPEHVEMLTTIVKLWSESNKALVSIARSLEKLANPRVKLDRNDPDAVAKASQSIEAHKKRFSGQVGQS